ncbi:MULTISPECIES: hypothetical protein [Anoxybacillaceae]|jgi:hypothetical protein|uniref:Uncharacterized protein n=1 Tax=Parageobacillus caldoxylosilyticus NBRC 107762 TaxID=1220594 RepID=A0A023DF22_9BACL|nr:MULTISPECIES: hypothetical protein [Bacillaceae]MBB3853165.1 hypothetical protein [Parageobacillus caldoxylosilyticus]MED0661408.1 hypothetical protein [Geobacillus thermodenitrificans]GAJ39828.1 hypothetical protein GCA01S_029_00060 [Parageobacillus caldoxylosilyticus NBRC 107762]GCD80944.1 hypothetical protein PTHTG4_00060 [Parageobacillus thermoglucosidasius]
MSEQKLGITEKYSQEILEIENKLRDLENNRVYELSHVKMDGSLATNARQLREMIRKLLYKIDNQLPSINDELASLFQDKKE